MQSSECDAHQSGSDSRVVSFTCGGLAGAAAQTVSYPLDLIRRRYQVQDFKQTPDRLARLRGARIADSRQVHRCRGRVSQDCSKGGFCGAVQGPHRQLPEGFQAFHLAHLLTTPQVVPAMAVTFVVYEEVANLLKNPEHI